jgi:hypothetical protein
LCPRQRPLAGANAALCNLNFLVPLWIMGEHLKRLMTEEEMAPREIADATATNSMQLYAALTVREEYASVQDIP